MTPSTRFINRNFHHSPLHKCTKKYSGEKTAVEKASDHMYICQFIAIILTNEVIRITLLMIAWFIFDTLTSQYNSFCSIILNIKIAHFLSYSKTEPVCKHHIFYIVYKSILAECFNILAEFLKALFGAVYTFNFKKEILHHLYI